MASQLCWWCTLIISIATTLVVPLLRSVCIFSLRPWPFLRCIGPCHFESIAAAIALSLGLAPLPPDLDWWATRRHYGLRGLPPAANVLGSRHRQSQLLQPGEACVGQLLLLRIKGSMLCNICLLFLTASLRPEIDLGQGEVSDANCTQVITSFVSLARIVN